MSTRAITGSRAIVTGASSGIGSALARALARQDAALILTARRAARLEQLASELRAAGRRIACVAGDITSPGTRHQLLQTARDQLGGLDLLINNAGVGTWGPFADADPARLRQVMEVNFFAPVELIRDALPLLAQGRKPMIVNISSVLGHRGVPGKSEYCASKSALHGFSDALRAELAGRGIDVLLVSPSTTESEFFDRVLNSSDASVKPSRRGMSADRVARLTLRAIRHGRHEIILSPGGKLLVWLDRLSPPLMNRLLARFG